MRTEFVYEANKLFYRGKPDSGGSTCLILKSQKSPTTWFDII